MRNAFDPRNRCRSTNISIQTRLKGIEPIESIEYNSTWLQSIPSMSVERYVRNLRRRRSLMWVVLLLAIVSGAVGDKDYDHALRGSSNTSGLTGTNDDISNRKLAWRWKRPNRRPNKRRRPRGRKKNKPNRRPWQKFKRRSR